MSPFIYSLLHLSVLAYALIGGVFLAFSDFIMRALAQTSGAGGAEAMQIINRTVFRWVFMTLFLGMAAVSLLIAIYCMLNFASGPGLLILAGALVYLIGCFAVTVVFNVPMNEALAGMDATARSAQDYWTGTYLPRWTWWNTVRAVACTVSAALMLGGVVWLGQARVS